ncbi:hypothetical protein VP150E351_P0088 [Vibrio phage 150E35-1]|nr:hypothetical protein VP150E351_P0088 [Vibrio phage 150E35-1]
MAIKLNLEVLGVADEPSYREEFIQHIPEMFNLKLESATTGQELIDALLAKFENLHHNHKPADYLAAIKEWGEFNNSEVDEEDNWYEMTVIPMDEGDVSYVAFTFYVLKDGE